MSRKASMSEADALRTSTEEFWSKMDQKGDALTSGYFKTAPDGRKLFFPWGVLGRGYTINWSRITNGCGGRSKPTHRLAGAHRRGASEH